MRQGFDFNSDLQKIEHPLSNKMTGIKNIFNETAAQVE